MRRARLSLLCSPSSSALPSPRTQPIESWPRPRSLRRWKANLQQLTDQIGGRVPGTPAMQKAVDWGVAAVQGRGRRQRPYRRFLHPGSWAEGATRMTVVAPEQFALRAVSIAWAPALAPHTHVPSIDVGQGTEKTLPKPAISLAPSSWSTPKRCRPGTTSSPNI